MWKMQVNNSALNYYELTDFVEGFGPQQIKLVKLNTAEASALNYAYALNGSSKRYKLAIWRDET